MSSRVAVPFHTPTSTENSCCCTPSPAFSVVSVLDFHHSKKCVVVSHCGFNLQFPTDIWCRASFPRLICHLYIFFSEVSVQIFAHLFVFLLLSYKDSLYILDNSSLSHMTFANIFSHFVACLLILLTVAFTEQRFLILMKFSLSIISFMDCVFGVVSKKSFLYPRLSWFFFLYCLLGVLELYIFHLGL